MNKGKRGGYLSYPNWNLSPQPKASIVSNGRLLFETLGIKVQIKKWANKNSINILLKSNYIIDDNQLKNIGT